MYKVYMYTNVHNGKIYIGQTKNSLSDRAQRNVSNYRESTRFYNAILKYGWDSFVSRILCDGLTGDEANSFEEYYICFYNSTDPAIGYNIANGGCNHSLSDETRSLISKKAKERYRDKTKNPMYGKKHSSEAIAKMSANKAGEKNPMFGSKWTATQRSKCGCKGRKLNLTPERIEVLREHGRALGGMRKKSVRCIEDDKVFSSLQEAADHYGVKVCSLCDHLKGRTHLCKSHHFEYVS